MDKLLKFLTNLFCKKQSNIETIEIKEEIEQSTEITETPMDIKITKEELLKAGDAITPDFEEAFEKFFIKINEFRNKCGLPMTPTSYFRSKERQLRIYKDKAKKKEFPFTDGVFVESKVPMGSSHLSGLACDFADSNKKLAHWVLDNIDWCKENGYYFENFGANIDTFVYDKSKDKTPTWLHIQIKAPKSGRVIFNP